MSNTYGTFLRQTILEIAEGTPIFTTDLTKKLVNTFAIEEKRAKQIVNLYVSRWNGTILAHFKRGIYYRPRIGRLGKVPLNPDRVVRPLFIERGEEIIGYETGASFFNRIGLTTQMPRYISLASNVAMNKKTKQHYDELNVLVVPPKTIINRQNVSYLQLLDVLENKEHHPIDAEKPLAIIDQYIDTHHIDFRKLVKYAKLYYKEEVFQQVGLIAVGERI